MGNTIRYLNTDLELEASYDLTPLAVAFAAQGIFSLNVTQVDQGQWHARFETDRDHDEPETNIAFMIAAIESLPEPLQKMWSGCTMREFDIGYDCGDEPCAFDQGLSCHLLERIAKVGASLRITLYPPDDDVEDLHCHSIENEEKANT